MIGTIILEKDKEEELLSKKENSFNDVKSSMISPAKLSKTVSAFASSFARAFTESGLFLAPFK